MFLRKLLSFSVLVSFAVTSIITPSHSYAAEDLSVLPAPGTMVDLSPAYQPVIIRGLTVHKDNPFLFDFMVDVGQDKMSGEALKKEGEKLIKYFLAGLAIPDKEVWVNLSPYEKNRIIPEALGRTDMGRDLLEQDYILKQMTASLIYPERQLGKEFWDRVYTKAREMYGTTQVPINTFNKVWIMADRAEVFEHDQTAFVVDQHLKVMLEQDYLALRKHADIGETRAQGPKVSGLGSDIVRQIILPELEKEVNTGKNFANLRQIFNSIILSSWYKKDLQQALLNQVYADKSRVQGIDLKDPTVKQQIYEQYLKAYKKGVFNYIKEDIDQANGERIPKKYFSGGMDEGMAAPDKLKVTTDQAMGAKELSASIPVGRAMMDITAGMETGRSNTDTGMMVPVNIADIRGLHVEEYETPEMASSRVAYMMADELQKNNEEQKDTRWILPTGGTYEPIYEKFREIVKAKGIRLEHLYTFNMDEYSPGEDYKGDWKKDPHSYYYFMHFRLFDHLSSFNLGWIDSHARFLNGQAEDEEAEAKKYEDDMRNGGGIESEFGGLGPTAHVAFNDPVIIVNREILRGKESSGEIRDFNEFLIKESRPEVLAALEELLTAHWSLRQAPSFADTLMEEQVKVKNGVTEAQLKALAMKLLMKQRTSVALDDLQDFDVTQLQGVADKVAEKLGLESTPKVKFIDSQEATYSRTRRVAPAIGTIRANIIYYFDDVSKMPVEAYTIGMGTSMDARRVVIAAVKPSKAEPVQKSLRVPSIEVPASILQEHQGKVYFIIDKGAGAKINDRSEFRVSSVRIADAAMAAHRKNRLPNQEIFAEAELILDQLMEPEFFHFSSEKTYQLKQRVREDLRMLFVGAARVLADYINGDDVNLEDPGTQVVIRILLAQTSQVLFPKKETRAEPRNLSGLFAEIIALEEARYFLDSAEKENKNKYRARLINAARAELERIDGAPADKLVDFLKSNPSLNRKNLAFIHKSLKHIEENVLQNKKQSESDQAMIQTPGGIDLSTSNGMKWNIRKDGKGVEMNMDPAMLARIEAHGIDSLSPVIFRITPVASVWSWAGLQKS